jgi:O-antigen ligase
MEAGAASRWSLLPIMWSEIRQSPVWGYGLGKSLTYQTYDPRVLESSSSGQYTTYVFEWGWLDIWLKFGILGVAVYVWLLFSLGRDAVLLIKKQPLEGLLILSSVLIIAIVHFFTPYLNHPLGFGYLGLLLVYITYRKHLEPVIS